jgi:hypothetical protein
MNKGSDKSKPEVADSKVRELLKNIVFVCLKYSSDALKLIVTYFV